MEIQPDSNPRSVYVYRNTAYWRWASEQGLPIHQAYGIRDISQVELAPWTRTGGQAAFVHLYGMEGLTGIHVGEIPPGEALKPERHLYEEVYCILEGRGITHVWWGDGEQKQWFEWSPYSVFAPPLNSWHRLVNASNQPVRYMSYSNAPLVMDLFRDPEFVFGCEHPFRDRYNGQEHYFAAQDKRYQLGRQNMWETNFIADVRTAHVDEKKWKGVGSRVTQFELSGNSLIGHLAEYPTGRYPKAHYHGPGAVILILRSEGYVLMWPKEAGARPYAQGNADQVVKMEFGPNTIYCPPGGWFHQHFPTGPDAMKQIAFRYGSRLHPAAFEIAAKRSEEGHDINIREGGTMIWYEDEDPEIRRIFDAALQANNVPSLMPDIEYQRELLAV